MKSDFIGCFRFLHSWNQFVKGVGLCAGAVFGLIYPPHITLINSLLLHVYIPFRGNQSYGIT